MGLLGLRFCGGSMRFALVDGQRRIAEKGLTGVCPACGAPVLAKCGEKKAHHWAHKRQCSDTWATGKETDWHLGWKNCFPEAWQERILKDAQSGEKHIADILTEHNLVVEFQHSSIAPEERCAREQFYSQDGRQMVWVVDCVQSKRDCQRCLSYIKNHNIDILKSSIILFPDKFFPEKWIPVTSVPVVLDIGYWMAPHDVNGVCYEIMPCLFCILFENHKHYCCTFFFKNDFISLIKNGELYKKIELIIDKIILFIKSNRATHRLVHPSCAYQYFGKRFPYKKRYYYKGGKRKIGGRSRQG